MDTDYTSVSRFHEQFPNLHPSEDAIRWELRFREDNGLLDSEAVLECRADPNATRPKILISPTKYFGWLRNQNRAS